MDSAVEVFDERPCELGEGPWYDERTGRLCWVDILGERILWRSPTGGDTGQFSTPGHIGAAVPRSNGGLVLCLPAGPALRDPDGAVVSLAGYAAADAAAGAGGAADGGRVEPEGTAPGMRSNDAKADRAGRLWLGTMAYAETPGAGSLYRLDPGAVGPERVLGNVTISNGLGWSPDGTAMYYVDSPTRRVDRFDYDVATGTITGRRTFAAIDADGAVPDGLCVDAAGGVWVALHGGAAVHRYAPDGHLDRVVRLPTPLVTSCAFGGTGYDVLFITTAAVGRPGDPGAGRTYLHRPADVMGRPVDRCGF